MSPHVIIPDKKTKETLIEGKNTIHLVTRIPMNELDTPKSEYEDICTVVYTAVERGAVLGYDYGLTCAILMYNEKPQMMIIGFHALSEFVSDEDFPERYRRE